MKCNQVPTIKAEPREVNQFLSVPTGGFLLHLRLCGNHGKKTACILSPYKQLQSAFAYLLIFCIYPINYTTLAELAQFHVH